MFAAGISMAHLVEPQSLERELIALGRDHAGWGEAETRSSMHSIISRAQNSSSGETVVWEGERRDPRYRLTNKRIIEMLSITPDEQKEMKVLISKDTKRHRTMEDTKRHRAMERKRQKRRAEGVIPRQEYLAKANEKRGFAQELYGQGMSIRKISEKLSISRTKVSRLIAGAQKATVDNK